MLNSTKNAACSTVSDNSQGTPIVKSLSTPAKFTTAEGTPAKTLSTPAKLMNVTPALQRQKRSFYMSPVDDSARSPDKLVRCWCIGAVLPPPRQVNSSLESFSSPT
ncbi:hypothetical protein POM88_022696 [Heracleum sosnowskyi]|uniref:Uncharacterized protein n=1 Tax=Heracleum sosnowskyi TaxID=360622 RepID=A0AAD8MTU1_9APIA|nr:hypothetical protein POM88_022696 [Heracleum sosnowskyi]